MLVAIPTYRRPSQLRRVLDTLAAQRPAPGTRLEVAVFDNDPGASGISAVAAAVDQLPWPVRTRAVAEAGVVAVRNAALEEASASAADALVFLDDDLELDPGTVAELVRCWRRYSAAIVVGRCRFVVAESVWWRPVLDVISQQRRDLAEGDTVVSGGLGLSLLDGAFLRRCGLRFDPRFARTGGEDSRFIRQAAAVGHRAVSCPSAGAVDPVGSERERLSWIALRCLRVGNTWGLLVLEEARWRPAARATLFARAVAGSAVALLGSLAAGLALDRRRAVLRGANALMRAGRVLACAGVAVEEYRGARLRRWDRERDASPAIGRRAGGEVPAGDARR